MNIVLNCHANKGKGAYTLSKGGRVIASEVFIIPFKAGGTLKEYVLEVIIKGLKRSRGEVSHEDLLLIGLNNNTLASWLNGQVDPKGYESYFDRVFEILETIDCRYLFAKSNINNVKKLLDTEKTKVEVSGVSDAFSGLI